MNSQNTIRQQKAEHMLQQMLDVVMKAKETNRPGETYSTKVGNTPYKRYLDDHTLYTGFHSYEYDDVEAWLTKHYDAPIEREENSEGSKKAVFANGISMVYLPFRDNGISITFPESCLEELQQRLTTQERQIT